jgi:hypothetical protein
MIVEIPVPVDLPRFAIVVALDGTDYRLAMWWNTRDSRWYLSISLTDGTQLVSGVAVVVGFPLLGRFASPDLPPGMLLAIDSTGDGVEIGQQADLGNRVRLVYIPEADL